MIPSKYVVFRAQACDSRHMISEIKFCYSFIPPVRGSNRFLPRCMECRRGLAMRILFVCLSVRLLLLTLLVVDGIIYLLIIFYCAFRGGRVLCFLDRFIPIYKYR